MIRPLITLALLAVLTACGSRTRLYPQPGMATVPKAAAADRIEAAEELMRPSTQAQPGRQADLIGRSAPRKDDPFDLPPQAHNGVPDERPADAASPVPLPDNVATGHGGSGEGLPPEPDKTDPNAPAPTAPPNR